MRIAVIPARGGSKRIPRKNIKLFCGKPIIAWSIEAALNSGCFDLVIVSTDDQEIASVAQQYGAHIPFLRPSGLADDHTGTIPVIAHATKFYLEEGAEVEQVCCVYATAPFVRPEDLREGLERLNSAGCDYVFSVTSYAFPIQRAIRIKSDLSVDMYQPECFDVRSQDLEAAFHDAGQFYWGKASAWIQQKRVFGTASQAMILPRHCVQDIDTSEDWVRAEWMFRAMKSG